MVMEYVENIVQLIAILFALLFSLFRYISSKKRGWLYSVVFFTGSLLSSYFWTAYLIIMGGNPNASDTLTYFGWNVSYIVMLLLLLHARKEGEKKYFNALMLLPIPLNVWQLTLYLDFGGAVNSIYQVTICTAVACMCIRDIIWHIKNRKKGVGTPFIAIALLVYVSAEFGMWTASCFEGWAEIVYYLCSFLCSGSYFMILLAIRRTYGRDSEKTDVFISKKIQNIIKGSYVAILLICSVGGVLLGCWIRDMISTGLSDAAETEAYDIIHIILFLISIILSAFAIAIVLIVYFEQKISENNRLREEKIVAEQSNAAKSDFLASMSHEIRTPINAVLGMNRMIMQESLKARDMMPKDRESVRKVFSDITDYSGNIDSAGNSLLSIINDILDFSKIEAGKFDINEREYMLSSVLNDVSNTIYFKARDKGLDFCIEADSGLPDNLYGDDNRIRQIMINLLNNAVKYTDKGSVTLTVSGSGGYEKDKPADMTIAVRDTGIGIRDEDIGKIFGKFERTDLKRNSTVEGTGLGLAITHSLVDMMNGKITVESEYGKGSVFTVILPQNVISCEPVGDFRERFEKSRDISPDTEDIFRAPDARILIVDDTRMNLLVAAGLLKDTGMITDTAESGAAALDLIAKNSYDIILMDQRMPVMDGIETLHRMREREEGSDEHTPVICLTADALAGAKEKYISLGFDDYLSKPIDSRELKKKIMKYLPAEKVLDVSADDIPDSGDGDGSISQNALYSALKRIGVDTEKGLKYCQDNEELYRAMLVEYMQSVSGKLDDLQSFFENRDAENYGILVHSLKSNSRTIGAEEPADISADLEKAADEERWDIITNSHAVLTDKIRAVINVISDMIGEGNEDMPSNMKESEDGEILEFFPD